MRRKRLLLISLLSFAALAIALPGGRFAGSSQPFRFALSAVPTKEASRSQASVLSEYGKLPLTFEENRGQTDLRVKFLARGGGYTLFLTDDVSATLRLSAPAKDAASPRERVLARLLKKNAASESPAPDSVIRLALVGANHQAQVEGNDLQPGKSNYFIGNNPAGWHTNISQYARVKYRGVYPGIDLVYYGNQGLLESDYVLAPGADPAQIGLHIDGANSVKIDSDGDLRLTTSSGEVVLQKPRTYQQVAGERREIATNYVQRGPRLVGLHVASYNKREPLVIDPTMQYSTYLGGSGTDLANGIAVDSSDNAYVTGSTTSKDFPMPTGSTGFQQTFLSTIANAQEVFVSKMNPAGSGLVYSTYLGGTTSSPADRGTAIALDSAGEAYVTGVTGATDFPTMNPFQPINKTTGGTCFVTKLAANGASLVYSTYIGGSTGFTATASDAGLGIAVDSRGVAYITGTTTSSDFPTRGPGGFLTYQSSNNAASGTAFVSVINPNPPNTGTGTLVYSTFLGGSAFESGTGIVADPAVSGLVYVVGFTGSTDFPTVSAFQTALAAGATTNAFISQMNTTLGGTSALTYSTYLGGSPPSTCGRNCTGDRGNGIAVDASFNVYVAGITGSLTFPFSASAYQTTNKGVNTISGFVARLDTSKSGAASRIYSTYLGGGGNDLATGIAIDSQKNAYILGVTTSGPNTFPVSANAPQTINNAAPLGQSNEYVFVLDPTGSSQVFATFWGGSATDVGTGIALDAASPPNIFITGTALSKDMTVSAGAFQTTRKTGNLKSAYIAKFSGIGGAAGSVSVSPTSVNFGSQTVSTTSAAQSVTVTNGSSAKITISNIQFTGTNAADFAKASTSTCTVGGTVAASGSCHIDVTFTPAATGTRSGNLVITDATDSGSPHTVPLSGSGTASGSPDFTITLAPTTGSVASGGNVNVTVTVTSTNGFNSAVALTCTDPAPASGCKLTPSSVTPAANATATSTAAITTTKHTVVPVPYSVPRNSPRPFPILGILCLVAALMMAWIAARRGARRLAFGFALLSLLALTSCSGLPGHGTTPGNYTLTVTGKSGSLTHPASFTLTVN